jgi:hypothetical protein
MLIGPTTRPASLPSTIIVNQEMITVDISLLRTRG